LRGDLQTVWKQNHVNTRRQRGGGFASVHGPRFNTARHNERRKEMGMAGQRRGTSRFDHQYLRGASPPELTAALRTSPDRGAQFRGLRQMPFHRSKALREWSVWVRASGRCAFAQSAGGNNNSCASKAESGPHAFAPAGVDGNKGHQRCSTIHLARRAESYTKALGIESIRPLAQC
jgi:hypothetical protein